jgi:hypothetical protein
LGAGFQPDGYHFQRLIAPAYEQQDPVKLMREVRTGEGERLVNERVEKVKSTFEKRLKNKDDYDVIIDALKEHLETYRDNRVFNWRLICRAENVYDWAYQTSGGTLDDLDTVETIHFRKLDTLLPHTESVFLAFQHLLSFLKSHHCIISRPGEQILQPQQRKGQSAPQGKPISLQVLNLDFKEGSITPEVLQDYMKLTALVDLVTKVRDEGFHQMLWILANMQPYTPEETAMKGNWMKELEVQCFLLSLAPVSHTIDNLRNNRVKKWALLKGTNFISKVIHFDDTQNYSSVLSETQQRLSGDLYHFEKLEDQHQIDDLNAQLPSSAPGKQKSQMIDLQALAQNQAQLLQGIPQVQPVPQPVPQPAAQPAQAPVPSGQPSAPVDANTLRNPILPQQAIPNPATSSTTPDPDALNPELSAKFNGANTVNIGKLLELQKRGQISRFTPVVEAKFVDETIVSLMFLATEAKTIGKSLTELKFPTAGGFTSLQIGSYGIMKQTKIQPTGKPINPFAPGHFVSLNLGQGRRWYPADQLF